ncbi:restriction endonuclease subunit S [Ruminococcus sp.]|uniref:restriction endonuclease subunit S n=1 Tax=Ruminococcus sp. TaxID=41978 RepID=UPI0025F32EF9|nr:restriction endonuclease subunit S [Ruminococcus sp.]MBQ8967184.1 restriction endonuclease subunit S [Ruminococcus sp.]
MADWKTVRLGDVCLIERGGSPRPIEDFITDDEDGINWIKIGDTNESKYITKTEQKIKKEGMKKSRFVQEGDFLLSNSMSFGRPYILKINGCIHDGWLVIRDENDSFDKDYLYYYLSSPIMYQHFKSLAVGGVVNNLNSKMVRNVEVPLPPLETQRQIAANLDKVTHTIDLCNAILEKLDLLVKSRFVEMFCNTDDRRTIADICSIITDGTHQPPKFTQDGIPFLFVSNIVTNEITYNAEKFISEETYDELYKRTPIEIGDIVLSTVGSYGHPAVVKTNKKFLFQRHIAYLKPISSVVNSIYLHSAILSNDAQRQIEERVKGIAQKTLNLSEIRKITVPIPPLALQEQFAAFVEQTDKSKFIAINIKKIIRRVRLNDQF